MSFEQTLYEAMGNAFPLLSVRAMSRMLGKSSGYWSSLLAQDITVSSGALVHLLDVLECQRITGVATTRKSQQIDQIQELIVQELFARFRRQTGLVVDDNNSYNATPLTPVFDALPFIVTCYS